MKKYTYLLFLINLIINSNLEAQNIFEDSALSTRTQSTPQAFPDIKSKEDKSLPSTFRLVAMKHKAAKQWLTKKQGQRCVDIPMPNGQDEGFILEEAPLMHPDLAAKYPSIKCYKGRSQDDPRQTIRVVFTARSFHAMGFGDEGTFFIEQVLAGKQKQFMSYWAKHEAREPFVCSTQIPQAKLQEPLLEDKQQGIPLGTELRTYRIAVSFHPDLTDNYATTADAMDRVVEMVSGLNVIFERDLCLTFQLIPNNDLLLFTWANNPYQGGGILGENNNITNQIIGSENYDIGMVVTQGGGGVSVFGVSCSGSKAATQTNNTVLYAAHELGHNMAASHTMNYCPGGGFNDYEPGSGNTLMAYAGLCGSANMPGGDIYIFHANSVREMYNRLYNGGGNCAASTPTGNTPPTVSVDTSGFYIPALTPFVLTGSGDDAEDPAALTYIWEQYDYGAGSPPWAPTGNDPVFRVYPIQNVPYRIFPELSKIINGTSDQGEVLPDYSREFNFRFTVRDNFPGGGGSDYEDIQFFVEGNAGPFVVNEPNSNITTWSVGQNRTVTWDVANTNVAPVNSFLVNILLSADGGYTYPDTLAMDVPNTGSYTVTVPNQIGIQSRIKVEAADNIFFDISNQDFEIVDANTHDFTTNLDTDLHSICSETSVAYQIDLYSLGTFTNNVELSLTDLPVGATLSLPASVSPISTTTLTISDLDLVQEGNYTMTLNLDEAGGGVSKTMSLYLTIKGQAEGLPGNAMSFSANFIDIPQIGGDYQFGRDKDFSIDFWLNTTSTAGDDAIMANKDWGSGRNVGWVFALQSGSAVFNIGDGSARIDLGSGSTLVNDGEWHHVAATVSRAGAGSAKLYVDGILKAEKLVTVGDISNNLPIRLGSDSNGSYKYDGQLEEVRIWRNSLTETEIRETMHRTLNTCQTDLISCYQFNEASGDVLDPISFYNGTVNGATRVVSTTPIGSGTANSQVEADGLVDFPTTNFSANYIAQDAAEVTTTRIDLAPYGNTGIGLGEVALDNQYWVVNRYEKSGTLDMTTTFTLVEDITTADETSPIQLLLYHRPANSDGAWDFLANAASADAANDVVSFNFVDTVGQFLITRTTAPVISLLPFDGDFCTTTVASSLEDVRAYNVEGVNLTEDITITVPVGFEISLMSASGFSPDPLTLTPNANAVAPTMIYIKFNPPAIGDYGGEILHSTAGGDSRSQLVSGTAIAAASDFSDMAMQFDGDGDNVAISELTWQPTAFTVEFWLKPFSLTNYNQQIGSGWGSFLFHAASNGSFYTGTNTGSSRIQSPAATLQLNTWSHCAVTFDNGLLNVYHNGEFIGSQPSANMPAAWSGNFKLGSTDGNAIDGELDEFRIWDLARTQQQIREGMHLTHEVEQGCNEGLMLYYQFNALDTTSLGDVMGFASGNVNGNATLVTASLPVGEGFANTQAEATGSIDFTNTDCSVDFTTQNGAEVVFTKINNAPYDLSSLLDGDVALDAQYWVAHRYGTDAFEGNITFTLSEDLDTNDENTPESISLYGRHATSDSDWTLLAAANSVNAASNQATFNGVTEFQQYLVARGTPTFRVQTEAQDMSVCKPNTVNIHFSITAVFGYDGNNNIAISVANGIPNTTNNLSASNITLLTPQTVLLEITDTQTAADGTYDVEVAFTDGNISQTKTISISLAESSTDDLAGMAMTFDGNGDYVDLGNQPLLDFGGTKHFSIEAWVKPAAANASGRIIGKYNRFIAGQYYLGLDNGQVIFQREVSPYQLTGIATLEADQWYHVAGTYDGNEMKIYINGELDNSQVSTGGASNNSTGILIGSNYYNGAPGYFLNAEIDEIRVWNRARTQQEVREYRHLVVDNCEEDLIAYFQFNEVSGDVIDPINGITGTLNGDAARLTASESCGSGNSYTQEEANGVVDFYFTDTQIDYTGQDLAEVVATRINNAPYGTMGIDPADVMLDSQYWVVNRYERSGTLAMSLTLTVNEDIAVAEESTPYFYNLYHRAANDYGEWTLLGYASNADATNEQLTFENVPDYGQYVITKNTSIGINLTSNLQDFGIWPVNVPSGVQSYTLLAKGVTEPVNITAPSGFEISTDAVSGFSSSLSFTPTNSFVGNTTIYVRFLPDAEQDYLGDITHSSTGVSDALVVVSGIGREFDATAGNALSCAEGDYLELPRNEALIFDETEDFTIEFWIYTTATNSDPAIISNKNWNSGNNKGWGIIYLGNDWKVNFKASGTSRVDANSSAPDINDGLWHHLAVVFDRDGMMSLYQDGVMTNQASIAAGYGADIDPGFPINVLQDGTGTYADGLAAKIDELRIWNTARTTQEIRENMHLTLDAPEAGLLAYYQFKETSGDALDIVGRHHGSFQNNSTRTPSDMPAAAGVSVTQNISATGSYSFDDNGKDTHLDLEFTTQHPHGDVVVSYLTGEGVHGDLPLFSALDDRYWIVHNYGDTLSGLNAGMTFTAPTTWVDNASPDAYTVFKRAANAKSATIWYAPNLVTNADVANDQITLTGVDAFSQFLPAKAVPATCYDGSLNGDETTIDCGGSCTPCDCTYELIDSEDFETDFGIWVDGGTDARRSIADSSFANSGDYCVRLRDDTETSVITTNILDLSTYTQVKVNFSFIASSMDDNAEDLWVQVSTDTGNTFTTIADWTAIDVFENNQRYNQTVLIEAPFTNTAQLRFRLDASGDGDELYLDDIQILACNAAAAVALSAKVYLQGNYNAGLMDDYLRVSGYISLNEPYTALNFTTNGGETTSNDVLSVSTENEAIVDWIFLELRDKNAPTAVLYSRSALLQRDGDIVDVDGISPVSFDGAAADDYYVAIRHRNHLSIRSANTISLSSTTTVLDFTTSATPVVGTNAQADLGGGILALWSGDATSDNVINAADRSETWNTRNQSGYLNADVTLDGSCNAADRSMTWNNRNLSGN